MSVPYERAYLFPVESGRGCPYGCDFCTVTGFFGDKLRFRSNESVITELLLIKSIAKRDKALAMVFFIDDNLAIIPLGVFGGNLYAGTTNSAAGAEVWRFDGTTLTQVADGGFGNASNASVLGVASTGGVHVATTNGVTGMEIWETTNGTAWEPVATGGFGDANNEGAALAMLADGLRAITLNRGNGAEVWQRTGAVGDIFYYLPVLFHNTK